MCHNTAETAASIQKLQAFDADENVLICIAHDMSLKGTLPFYPETLNEWKSRDLKTKAFWEPLKDFDLEGTGFRRTGV